MPRGAVHQGVNDGFYIGCAFLDIVVRMFIQTAGASARVNPHYGREVLVSGGASEDIEVTLDGASLVLNGEIVPIRKSSQEDSIFIVIRPAHIGILHAREDRGASPLG